MSKRETNEQKYLIAFGKGITRLRENLHKSLRLYANEAGISPATLCRLEHGERIPNLTTLKKLSAVINMSVSDYIQNIENNFSQDLKDIEF